MAIFFLFQKMFYRIHSLGKNPAECLSIVVNHLLHRNWNIEQKTPSRPIVIRLKMTCCLPTITISSEFLYLHPLKTILLLRNCSRPPQFKHSLKAWSNVPSNLTRTVIWCVCWQNMDLMDNRTSNNIQSQDGNSTIISKNWKKRLLQIFCLYKKTSSGQLTKWLEPLQYVHAT